MLRARDLVPLYERLSEHERRISGVEFKGRITDIAPPLARIEIGKDADGNPVKSPWLPYRQMAGAMKFHNPPSVGQLMVARAQDGDLEQGTLEPFQWSDDNPAPDDDPSVHKLTFGALTVTITTESAEIEVGGTSILLTPENLKAISARIDLN